MNDGTKQIQDKKGDAPASVPLDYFSPKSSALADRYKGDSSVIAFLGILLGIGWTLIISFCVYIYEPDFGKSSIPVQFLVWLICTALLVVFGEPQERNSKSHAVWSGFTAVSIVQLGLYTTIMIASVL